MNLQPYYSVICGAAAAGASITSGLWLIKQKHFVTNKVLHIGLAVSAGFLLAAVLLEIIPSSITEWEILGSTPHKAMALVLIGYIAMIFLERAIAPDVHRHFDTTIEPCEKSHNPDNCTDHIHFLNASNLPALISALAIHAFFDGVSIASGFLVSQKLGWIIFIALLLHKIPDGITVVSIVLGSGKSNYTAQVATLFTGFMTLTGAITMVFLQPIVPIVTYALPIAAGVTLHVAASDLVPEIIENHRELRIPFAILSGVVLFYLTHLLLEFAQT